MSLYHQNVGVDMKIILSRKGFDSQNGGCPSPIMPDGTLLSMPIPSEDDRDKYSDLSYNGLTYAELLEQLNPKQTYDCCHIDPDIRENNRVEDISGWVPAFGQMSSAQGVLANAEVERGDIFLFFGWFRRVEQIGGKYRFVPRSKGGFYDHADLHVIYGYMQIGDIHVDDITDFKWHPHAYYVSKPNVIYTAADRFALNDSMMGSGTLDYRIDRVLTLEGESRATWIPYPFLMPEYLYDKRKNSAKGEGLYYSGIWQELVLKESEELLRWVRTIVSG